MQSLISDENPVHYIQLHLDTLGNEKVYNQKLCSVQT